MKYLTFEDIKKASEKVSDEIIKRIHANPLWIYAIPRGGIPAAYSVMSVMERGELVSDIKDANIILDDLIDSGATKKKYTKMNPDALFVALFDKQTDESICNEWLVFPWENNSQSSAEDIPIRFLQFIEEDMSREGLIDTPSRVVKSWGDLYKGYKIKIEDIFTVFESEGYDELVILRSIEFYSTCEHHLLPFFGKAHIAYIPDKKVIGISKLVRLLEAYSRRIQIQERLTKQITTALDKYLNPIGSACVIEATHLCIVSRGVEKQHSTMITSSLSGVFREDSTKGLAARQEVMRLFNI